MIRRNRLKTRVMVVGAIVACVVLPHGRTLETVRPRSLFRDRQPAVSTE